MRRDLGFVAYWVSVIIGAGLLLLPLQSYTTGYLPLWFLIIAVSLYITAIYTRLAHAIRRHVAENVNLTVERGTPAAARIGISSSTWMAAQRMSLLEIISGRGQSLYDDLIESRLDPRCSKTWARVSFVSGILFFVFFSVAAYVSVGGRSLSSLVPFVARRTELPWLLLVAGVMFVSLAAYLSRYTTSTVLWHGVVIRLLALFGSWAIALFVLAQLPSSEWESFLIFALSLLPPILLRAKIADGSGAGVSEQRRHGAVLYDHHRLSVAVVLMEMLLLVIAVVLIVFAFAVSGTFRSPQLLVSPLTLGALGKTAGVVVFAFVGTGIYNLMCYPSLLDSARRLRNVIILGTALPTLAYLVWSFVVAITLSPSQIQALNGSAGSYPTIVLARMVMERYPLLGLIISIFGYAFAMLAVSMASIGFVETLSDRVTIDVIIRANRFFPFNSLLAWLGNRRELVNAALLVATAVFAVFTLAVHIEVTTVVGVAGIAGGGLILLVIPWLIADEAGGTVPLRRVVIAFLSLVFVAAVSVSNINMNNLFGPRFLITLPLAALTLWVIGVGILTLPWRWNRRRRMLAVEDDTQETGAA